MAGSVEDEISLPDNPPGARARSIGLRRVLRSRAALAKLREIESELREQASGSQDGYLLDVANRMREALKTFN
jgi:CHASE3 domain sensor protein